MLKAMQEGCPFGLLPRLLALAIAFFAKLYLSAGPGILPGDAGSRSGEVGLGDPGVVAVAMR